MQRERLWSVVVAFVVAAGVASVVGLAVWWPAGPAPDLGNRPTGIVDATVTRITTATCDEVEVPGALSGCRIVGVRIDSGDREGTSAVLTILDTQFEVPDLKVGDPVVLRDSGSSGPEEFRYSFSDFQRRTPLVVLVVLFVVVVAAFGRGRGLRSLAGLLVSVAVLAVYVVPALLRGSPALGVALAGSVVVGFLALYLAHGVNRATTVALAGTLGSLLLIAGLSAVVASVARFTGLADETAQTLRVTASGVDLRGLLVAGFVVGALGVLDDVTVTQVSTVQALWRARPDLRPLDVAREALEVGRDHIASTVNTLVLAYAGAALPLLLFFEQDVIPASRVLTGEVVATELARMLVGSIGLVASVPLTTAIAAAVLTPGAAPLHDHGHGHGHDHGPDGDHDEPGDDARGSHRPSWDDFAPEDG